MCPAGIWTVGLGHALINKKTGKWLKGQGDYQEMLRVSGREDRVRTP